MEELPMHASCVLEPVAPTIGEELLGKLAQVVEKPRTECYILNTIDKYSIIVDICVSKH
jgi:hypothetical protein